jgi:hypothetical protein
MTFFEHEFPFNPSDFSHFRKRIKKAKRAKKRLRTIACHQIRELERKMSDSQKSAYYQVHSQREAAQAL